MRSRRPQAVSRRFGAGVACLVGLICGCGPERIHDFYVLAHADDDLFFMNPDLRASLAEGNSVRAVFLTAGDAGVARGLRYARARERGSQAAYTAMLGASHPEWMPFAPDGSRALHGAARSDAPVSLVFLRLPDGGPRGTGFAATGGASLERLWTGEIDSLRPIDGAPGFTKADLTATLADLMREFRADRINTLDPRDAYPEGHSDHRHAARFALAARSAGASEARLRLYRDYSSLLEPANLSAQECARKAEIIAAYAASDPLVPRAMRGTPCQSDTGFYERFLWRQYQVAPAPAATDPQTR